MCVKFILIWGEFQLVGMDLSSKKASFLPGHLAWYLNFPNLKLAVLMAFSVFAKLSLWLLTFFQQKSTLISFYFVLVEHVFSYFLKYRSVLLLLLKT